MPMITEGTLTLTRDSHEFYEDLIVALTIMALFAEVRGKGIPRNCPNVCTLESMQSGLSLRINLDSVLVPLLGNSYTESLEIVVAESDWRPERNHAQTPIQHLFSVAFENLFIAQYSRIERRIKQRFGNSPSEWNGVAAFAWIVRNAFGHGRKITVQDQRVVGEWRGVVIGRDQLGEPLLYHHLSQADLLVLLLDLDLLLTRDDEENCVAPVNSNEKYGD